MAVAAFAVGFLAAATVCVGAGDFADEVRT